MCEPLGHSLQPLQIPKCVACRAEEDPPHVVVHAHNFMPLPVEMLHRFRTDQSAAAGHENFHPFESQPLSVRNKPKKKRNGIPANRIREMLRSTTRGPLPH